MSGPRREGFGVLCTIVLRRSSVGPRVAPWAAVVLGLAVLACGPGPSSGSPAVSGPASPGAGGGWRSVDVCRLLPAQEVASLLGGLTAGPAVPADPAAPWSCRYVFVGGDPAELTITLGDAAAYAARYQAAYDAVSATSDVELRDYSGLFDEAFATSTAVTGVELWVRKGSVAAALQTAGTIDERRSGLFAIARALLDRT